MKLAIYDMDRTVTIRGTYTPFLLFVAARMAPWRLLLAPFALLAMAGPSFRKTERPLWQAKAPLVIAIDLSSAVLARDLPPTRLAQARAKLARLLQE